ncbi:unnamed protein product [Plutella xylostella]|uniref:(diamondback moth) hypothetical protein n=1 Tax=Plutella xylostella TaxID=51655 RepID=A0A8S4F3Q2_PLUXY|nr:unnamed protein product [Plutella xylostella]
MRPDDVRKLNNSDGERSHSISRDYSRQSNTALDRRKRVRRDGGHVVITRHFTERTVTPGVDISMECAATGDRPPQFVWERDGVVITSNTDPRYALGQLMTSDTSVVSQLNISRARVEDGGGYACTARLAARAAAHSARLHVHGPPYIRSLPPIKVQSGEPVNLRCPFYGYPISKIEWEYKGQIIATHPFQTRYKRHLRSQRKTRRNAPIVNFDGMLTIQEITKEENGAVFTCIVTSPSGEMARRAFEVQVIEAPVLEDLLLGANLQEGQIVNIYCNVRSGDLPIHFEWLKDGKRIPNNLKVAERSSELFSALVIKKVSLEHCGTYTCVASNHVAKVNKSTELYIKVAPKWVEEPTNSSLLLGRRGTVSCTANGYPQPQVHWMKKDGLLGTWQPVLELAGGGILSLPNGTLVIEEVSLSDEGLYSCNVENGVGQPLSRTVWMSVNKPVHFESSSQNVTTRLGHAASLACRPLGDDPVRVSWTHDGRPVDFRSQRSKLSEQKTNLGVTSTISLQYSEISDGGIYQCRASNPYGSSVFTIYHTILEPPTPPTDLLVQSVRSRYASALWRDSRLSHWLILSPLLQPLSSPNVSIMVVSLKEPPTPPTDLLVQSVRSRAASAVWRDSRRALHYSLQYAAPPRAPRLLNVTRQDNEIRQKFELQDLRPATAYTLRVASGNQVDLSPYTGPVHFTTLEEAPSSPPLNVAVEQTENPGELHVSWQPPPPDAHNGVLVGYHVKAVPQNVGNLDEGDTRMLKVSHHNGKQDTILSGLLKNVRYSISVAASTNAGSGPFSVPVYQDTREGAPELAPSSVECTAVSSTSVRVGWQPIALPGQGSSLVGYNVLYSTDEGAWQNATSLHTEFYIQGLMKYTNYTVKVAGFSSYGAGPYSYPIVCSTLEDVPGPPEETKVLTVSATSLLVSWKKPLHPNGQILRYTVYVKPISSTSPPQGYRVEVNPQQNPRTYSLEVKELSVSRQYEVWVAARSGAGEGAPGRRVPHATKHRVVAGVASLGGTISVGVGSSLLLVCQCVGIPPPRTVWYHKHNIITHHPRFTRNHDDSLLINNIDQSLAGNYTCLAKNLYGSDSVEYTVVVLPRPEPPVLRASPSRDALVLEWSQPRQGNETGQKIIQRLPVPFVECASANFGCFRKKSARAEW